MQFLEDFLTEHHQGKQRHQGTPANKIIGRTLASSQDSSPTWPILGLSHADVSMPDTFPECDIQVSVIC